MFSWFFKRFEVENCFVCAMAPLKIQYPRPTMLFCSHLDKSPNIEPCFKTQPIHSVAVHMCNLTVFAFAVLNFKVMYEVCGKDSGVCFVHFSDELYLFLGLLLSTISTIRIELYVLHLNGWTQLVKNCRDYGVPKMLTSKNCRSIVEQTALIYSIFFLFNGIVITVVLSTLPPIGDDRNEYVIQYLCIVFSSLTQFLVTIQVHQLLLCHEAAIDNIKKRLFHKLNHRLLNTFDVSDFLRKINRCYLGINMNFKSLNDLLLLDNVVWIIFSVVSLILNFYLVLDYWDNEFVMDKIVSLEIQNNVVILLMANLCRASDKFSKVNCVVS